MDIAIKILVLLTQELDSLTLVGLKQVTLKGLHALISLPLAITLIKILLSLLYTLIILSHGKHAI